MNPWSLVLLVPVLLAVVCDLRTQEVPDWVPLGILAWACLATALGLHKVTWLGATAGALLGLGLSAAVFYLGGLGGGDVKLLTAIGDAVGPWALLSILVWMALAGGILALIAAGAESGFFPTCRRSPSASPWKPFGREDSHVYCCTKIWSAGACHRFSIRAVSSSEPTLFSRVLKSGGKPPHSKGRRGQALVEFAVVSLVVYLLLAAILTFGLMFYEAQTVQQAADVAAREISRTPLSATANLMDVLYSNVPSDYSSSGGSSTVRTSLFNPQLLQFDMTTGVQPGQSVLNVIQTWPIVNQMLYPAMIVQTGDQVYGGNPTDQYLCYPGVVPCTDSTSPNRTVYCVARVDGRTPDGAETITWVPVIEEMTSQADQTANVSPFSVISPERGLVSLRLNYGYQSATMMRLSAVRLPAVAELPPWGAPRLGSHTQSLELHSNRYSLPSRPSVPIAAGMDWERKRRGATGGKRRSRRRRLRHRGRQSAYGRFGA